MNALLIISISFSLGYAISFLINRFNQLNQSIKRYEDHLNKEESEFNQINHYNYQNHLTPEEIENLQKEMIEDIEYLEQTPEEIRMYDLMRDVPNVLKENEQLVIYTT